MRWPVAACVLLATITLPQLAHAGMGNRATTPIYRPEPCQGDACKADDPRSGTPCQGLICSFSSAKALQPPVTAAQAAEAQQKAAAEKVQPIETVAPAPKTATAKKKRVKSVAKSDGGTEGAKPSSDKRSTTAR